MALMTKIKQEDYLKSIEQQLSCESVGLIADALEEEGDRVVLNALNSSDAEEDEQESYNIYLFEGETSPYSVFQKAVMAAGERYAQSDCKIEDLTAQNRAIQRAMDAFIVSSQQGEYQIDQAFFDDYQPEFFTHIYENEETFMREARRKAEQVLKPLEE
ncbi:MAG: hypothetical protein K0U37_02050 [Gammaproteobacteria bacterium]|nr:hypothetical protein [Gammaproteobacteria bacterium]